MDYMPPTPPMSFEDFPVQIQPYAKRTRFCGNGSESAPFIHGWMVRSVGTDLSYNQDAKNWFKAHGFHHSGGKWYLRDDVSAKDFNSWAIRFENRQ